MKTIRYILLTALMATVSMSLRAQQRNVLQVPDMRTQTGNVQLPIAIENTDEIVGAQFDITLPSGVTANAVGTMSNRSDGHSVTVTKVSNGAYRVLLHSSQNFPLRGQSGTVMYLPINIPSSFPEGSEYPITVSNAVLGKATGANVLTDVVTGKIQILRLPDLTLKSITSNKQTINPGDHIVVSWQVENVGELATGGGWGEQISLISEGGTQSKLLTTTHYEDILGPSGVVSRQVEIPVPALLGLDGQARIQVRILTDNKTGEPASAQANNTQQGASAITIKKVLSFELSPTRVDENRNTRVSLKVTRSGLWTEAETFPITATSDGRAPVPAEITIPANQATAIVYFNIVNNDVLDNDSIVNISVGGNGYTAVKQTLMVIDDEFPTLSLSANPNVVNEGDSIVFTVSAQRAPSTDVLLHLTCDAAKRFELPIGVFLRQGQTTTQLVAYAKDDDQLSTTVSPEYTIAADGYVSAKTVIILYDNDVPSISLTLSPTTLSESAGPVAMMAVLRRTTNTDKDITVKLSDDSQTNDINYGQFKSISMPKGVEEVEFSLGINDNLNVDGDRDVTLTAAVYIQSCSCSASGEDAGAVSQQIHIIDNDGPSLTLTSSRSSLLEGADEATVLTISRNTSVSNPLSLTLSSTYDAGLEYSHSVVIPAGQRTVNVPVKVLSNLNVDDSNMVTFTATAPNHSDGTCWAMVTDQTMPDAVVSSMQLLTTDGQPIPDNSVMVRTKVQALFTVENKGVIDLPAGTVVNLYQNSSRVTSMSTSEPIAPGQSATFTYTLTAPERIGTLSAYAKVNEDQTVRELIYANNTSATASVSVKASFTATVSVDKSVIQFGDSITISGQLTPKDDATWQSDGTTSIDLYLLADGNRYVQRIQAATDGSFSLRWGPTRSQIGHVGFGACYPDEGLRDEMASIDIYGMRLTSSHQPSFYTVLDQPYSGTIKIQNPGRLPLTGFDIAVIDNPDEATITIDAPTEIPGGTTANICFTLTGHKIGGSNDWQTISLSITTAEGPSMDHTLYYYTRNPQAQLSCSIQQINTTVTKGYSRELTFNMANIGLGNTGTVSLSLPSWMQSVTPMQMAPMAQGDTTQVVIRLTPTDDMQLNVPVTGQIAINCENGNGLTIPFRVEPVSENTGTLVVDVCDEFTYYTDEAPHVSGATVTIQHPTTGAVIAQGTTDESGCYSFTLPEGFYTLLVTHPKHTSYRATLQLDPGKTTRKVVNLSYDAVEVSWEVVETSVEDVYDIVTTVKYETSVPVPVVTVNLPQSIEADMLEEGESLIFYAVMTNKGLIEALDVQFDMPEGYTELKFEALDYTEPFTLAPQQSVTMPIKVTRLPKSAKSIDPHRVKPLSEDDCYAQFPMAYTYICGTDRKYHKYWNGLRIAKCEGKTIPVSTREESGTTGWGWDGAGWGNGGLGSPNYPGNIFGISTSTQKKVESTGEPYECTPCAGLGLYHALKLLPVVGPLLEGAEIAKDIYNCGLGLAIDETWHDKLANCKFTAGAIQRYDNFVGTAQNIYKDFGLAVDGAIDVVALAQNGQLFTQDCLDSWKQVYNGLSDTFTDAVSFATQAQSYAKDLEDMGTQFCDYVTDLQGRQQVFVVGKEQAVFTDPYKALAYWRDHPEEYEEIQWEKARQNVEGAKEYFNQNIATVDNAENLIKGAVDMAYDGKVTRDGLHKVGNDVINLAGEGFYHLHKEFDMFNRNMDMTRNWNILDYLETGKWNPAGNLEHASTSTNYLLKDSYINGTAKLAEHADDVMDVLYYEFGGCDYEGTEDTTPSGDDHFEAGEGGGGGGSSSHVKAEKVNSRPRKAVTFRDNTIPWEYVDFIEKAKKAVNIIKESADIEKEFFGDPAWLKLNYYETAPVAWAIEQLEKHGAAFIDNPNLVLYCPDGISLEMMQTLLRRWYNTYYVSKNPTATVLPETDGTVKKMDVEKMSELREEIRENNKAILSGDEGTIFEAVTKPLSKAIDKLEQRKNSVCASITLQFNQTMTMTRQAFRGTLKVHNGNAEGEMKDIVLQLEVRNAQDGTIATSHEMQINAESLDGFVGPLNLTSGWTLAPNADGTATILFIPSKYAAPTEPQDYTFGGRLRYLDPFTDLVVTRELSPVTLTVKPSPELDLTYFMQRDVYGDDPLTMDVVEPVKEAEFALLINNKGYGDATDVRMVTQQPQIVDNEKGLKIEFQLVSSQVNGADANLSFGQTIVNDFGTIPTHSQMYAQWWLTSSLLGHFTDYDVQTTHVTSYGNEDLSLLDQVTIHELIHGFNLTSDGQTLRAFLVNDLPDSKDEPDMLYLSNGDIEEVSTASSSQIDRTSSTTCTLTIEPSKSGWNYGNLLDPTHGLSTIKSIVRKSDGAELQADNFWQTDRTLRDGSDPLYENRLHFIDQFEGLTAETYVITFDPVPDVLLEVASIEVVPEEGTVAFEPVDQLTVTFSKPVMPKTFTTDDLAFVVQGQKQDGSQIGITTTDNKSFLLDLKAITEQCPNGYYTLSVQTADIIDTEGYHGKNGKQVGWILFRGGLVQLFTSTWPENSGSITRSTAAGAPPRHIRANTPANNTAEYGSTIVLTAMPNEGFEFANWTLNGEVVSTEPELETLALGDMNIVANFTKKNYFVEVEAENGSVTGTATGFYQHGEELTFTAMPYSDYIFTGWTVNGTDRGTASTLTLTANHALNIKADFVRDIYHQRLSLQRGWNWISSYLREPQSMDVLTRNASRVLGQFDEMIRDPEYGLVGGISAFEPGVAYKVNATSMFSNTLNGHLYDLAASPLAVQTGWNWIAYPYDESKPINDILTNSTEGDYIAGQNGFTEYVDGYWQGSLTTFEPGAGYMYKSASNKTLDFNFEAREEAGVKGYRHFDRPVPSSISNVDIYQYPNTMNITATLIRNGESVQDENVLIYAFVGDELRGVSQYVGNNYYLTVYGEQPAEITFIIEDDTTGEFIAANEILTFKNDVVGSRKSPFIFTLGDATSIDMHSLDQGPMTVYAVDGRLISKDADNQALRRLPKGIYIINGKKCFVK